MLGSNFSRHRASAPALRGDLWFPLIPGLASVGLLQRHEQRIVIQPPRTGREKFLIPWILNREVLESPAKQIVLRLATAEKST